MEAGHPITPDLYRWILRALKKDKRLPGVFKYVRQPNRTPSAEATDKHVQAYFRIEELLDENISRKLCAHVRGLLPDWEQRAESSGKGKKIIILDGNGVRVFRWVLGEKPSRDDAIRVAALELNMSFSSRPEEHTSELQSRFGISYAV